MTLSMFCQSASINFNKDKKTFVFAVIIIKQLLTKQFSVNIRSGGKRSGVWCSPREHHWFFLLNKSQSTKSMHVDSYFVFTKYLRAQLKDKIQSAFLFEQLVDNHLRINLTSRLFVKKSNPSDGFAQAGNQLRAPGGARSFLRGPKFLSFVQSGP